MRPTTIGRLWIMVSVLLAGLSAAAGDAKDLEASIRAAEYEISVHDGVFQAPNREHGFRTRFLESGIVVVPRTDVERPWSWGLSWTGYGRGEVVGPVPPAELSAKGNRIDYRRGRHVEWYENLERGLKQSFLLAEPPAGGSGRVRLDLALTGDLSPTISDDGQAIDFTRADVLVLRYTGLVVTDARGRDVPARMEGIAGGIRIVLDDADAIYPITIDPLATSPSWTVESNLATAEFGRAVASAGDVNGDGYSDLLIGAYLFDNGQTDEGRVYLFLGSSSGLATTAAWTAESDQAGSRFGQSVAAAGDVNGDGFGDVIVGAPFFDNGQTDEGRAFVYLGSASGLAANPAWTIENDQAGSRLGTSVATAGDVNDDGYSDVLVGAPYFDDGQTDEGRASLYLGSVSGPAATAAWTGEGNYAGGQYGHSVASAGDVNGDGYSDVVIGIPHYAGWGRIYVYFGVASGLSGAVLGLEVGQPGCQFGYVVGTAGDVNGDGYADVIVTAPFFDNGQLDEGRAYVYHGNPSNPPLTLAWTEEVDHADAYFGWSAGTAGDINADGYADVVVGEPFYFTSPTEGGGRAYAYYGSSSGLPATPNWTTEVSQANAAYGYAVATAGDVNGDGRSDVVVGSPWEDNGQTNEGRSRVYLGGSLGLSNAVAWSMESNQNGAQFGTSASVVGDVNGDGYADVAFGAHFYDGAVPDDGRVSVYYGNASGLGPTAGWTYDGGQSGAEFGMAVAGAGDVNGDGYADVVVGARFHDTSQPDAGRVYLFLGSPSGLSPTPAWTFDGDQAGGNLGVAVRSAGDVNADGYSDVVVGAYQYDAGEVDEGVAYLFLGSPSGLSASPAWTAEGNQAGAAFGVSVSGAGDVNGDGFGDVIVGAWFHDNGQLDEGRVYVYHGTASGLSATPAWTAERNLSAGGFGMSVRSAGDVNGDGFSDVIVGAYFIGGGRAYVYHGSATGLAAAYAIELYQSFAQFFGFWISEAGDVNADGYGDVAVASYPTNQVFLYLGSAAGIPLTAALTFSGTGDFGYGLGGGGDVNGDGFADLVIGAPLAGSSEEGIARLYLGREGPHVLTLAQQRTSDDARAVLRYGATEADDAFRLAMRGRTPFGRAEVRVETEVKVLGSPLNGTATQRTGRFDTGTAGGTIPVLVSGLAPGTPYHWRMRLLHDPVKTPWAPPRGRSITSAWGGWNEAMLRTPGPAATIQAATVTIAKAAIEGQIRLSWEPSCNPADADYAIYEGALGNFASHRSLECTTGGATSWTITPSDGSRYYLIVPHNGVVERSYGKRSSGAERPAGAPACRPQNVGVCP